MNLPKKCSAINALLALVLLSAAGWVQAASEVGTVINLSGPLFVKKPDGSAQVLNRLSEIGVGDTVSTDGKGYAQIRFTDDSLLTLQPDTVLVVDRFAYDAAKPAADQADFTLIRGGVRSDAGALGKRSKDRVTVVTLAARIDIQSGSAVVQYVPTPPAVAATLRPSQRLNSVAAWMASSATQRDSVLPALVAATGARFAYRVASVIAWAESWVMQSGSAAVRPMLLAALPGAPTAPTVAPGLYVSVVEGVIKVSNGGGAQSFSAGQFGYTPSFIQPPVIVPASPAIQFTPPPTFSSSTGTSGSSASKPGTVDCIVR